MMTVKIMQYLDIIHAFPKDELRPLTCDGINTLGGKTRGYALSLIDSLDSLIVFEQYIEFKKAVLWIIHHWTADIDENVSIFETNIRILGGLISAHMFSANDKTLWLTSYDCNNDLFDSNHIYFDTLQYCYSEHSLYTNEQIECMKESNLICLDCNHQSIYFFDCFYSNQLLDLSLDLAQRLMPAFMTPTNIPYGTVNLRHGVPKNETTIICTACAGSFLLEFGTLSLLSNRWDDFYKYAKIAAIKLYHARNVDTNLIGKHINNENGVWSQLDCSLGTFIDSYLEYLLKAYFIFYDDDLLIMFNSLWSSMWYHLNDKFHYNSSFYTEVRINDGQQISASHDTFSSFWPGLLTLNGNIRLAAQNLDSMLEHIIEPYTFMPENFNLLSMKPTNGSKQYFLRPELIESLYYLYKVTKDEYYLDSAWNLFVNINDTARVKCGFATIQDIESHILYNSMDSFWMSESLKYFYLMFQVDNNEYFLFSDDKYKDFIFTTEGHLIPLNVVHKIWNKQLRDENKTKHDFWRKYHWWKLEKYWQQMFDALKKEKKLKFEVENKYFMDYMDLMKEEYDETKYDLLINFLQIIENDKILFDEYQRMINKKENNALVWNVEKLKKFQKNVYDAMNGNDDRKSAYFKKTFENGKYADEWVKMGATKYWDCGQLLTIRKKTKNVMQQPSNNGVAVKEQELVYHTWSLRDCDAYVQSKCWLHRFVDNETCWI